MAFKRWEAPVKPEKQRPTVLIKKDSILIRPDAPLPHEFTSAPYAYLAYDDETHRVGIEPIAHKDAHTFPLRTSTRGLAIAASRFFADFALHTPQAEVADGQIAMEGDIAVFELKKPEFAGGSDGAEPKKRRGRRSRAEIEAARAAGNQ